MTNTSHPFDRQAFEEKRQELSDLLKQIKNGGDNWAPRRRAIRLNEAAELLDDLDTQLKTAWRDLLRDKRHAENQDAQANLANEVEQKYFDEALDLLPLYISLRSFNEDYIRLQQPRESAVGGSASAPIAMRVGNFEAGLSALQQGSWVEALQQLAIAGQPSDVKDQLQWQRTNAAERLLRSFTQRNTPKWQVDEEAHKQLRAVIRIGSGSQAAQARKLLVTRSPKRWLWPALVALALLLVGSGIALASGFITLPSSAPPTSPASIKVAGGTLITNVPIPTSQPTGGPARGLATAMPTNTTAPPTTAPVIEPTTVAPATAVPAVAPTETLLTPESRPTETATTAPEPTNTPTPPTDSPTATVPPATPTISATETLTMTGIKIEYAYTERIVDEGKGPQTRMREQPEVSSKRVGVLRNGDKVAVLNDDTPGWYQLRIVTSSDPAQIGQEGWIERWLVGTEAPPPPLPSPTPRPPPANPPQPTGPRTFVVAGSRSHPAMPASGEHQSCVTGRVVDRAGRGIDAARLYVNNSQITSETFATVNGGYYQYCGLGGGLPWSVVLTYIPGDRPIAKPNPIGTINVDGSSAQGGVVNFREQ